MNRSSFAFLVAVALVCVSCSSGPPPPRREIVIGLASEPPAVMADDPAARVIRGAVTETLVVRDPDGKFVPRLAERVPSLANGDLRIETSDASPHGRLVALFTLRSGATWQDGRAITTDDVRFALDDDRAAPVGTVRRWMADRVERIDAVDDRHVVFTYRDGERWPLYPLAPHVLPAHLLAGASPAQRAAYDREPVHAGPFRETSWAAGYGMTLRPFDGYVLGPPRLAFLQIRFYRGEGAVLDALRRGEVDVAPSPAVEANVTTALDRFAGPDAPLRAQYRQSTRLEMLRIGTRGAFADRSVRRALLLAIDRRAIVDDLFAGRVLVPRSYLVPPLDVAAPALDAPARDVPAASGLLARAGFERGSLGVQERGEQRLAVTLLVAGGSESRSAAARRVASDLAAVGIAATPLERPLPEITRLVAANDYDLALVPEQADDAHRASAAYAGLDPWFDVLLAAAAAEDSGPDRTSLYAELQHEWGARLPGIPLYQVLAVDVSRANLAGVVSSPTGEPLTWNVADWSFREGAPP